MEIIVGKKGTQKLPITDPMVSRNHCKLTEQPDGAFLLEDLGSANGTFVNGSSVIRTRVTRDTIIQLGPNLKVRVADLVGAPISSGSEKPSAPKAPTPPTPQPPKPEPVPEFSVKTLQYIWDEYQNELDEIRAKQKSINTWRMATPLFTMASGVLTAATGGNPIGWILMIIGLCITVYAFVKTSNDDSDERRKIALDKFQTHYICPNPKCGHTHAQSPKILLQNKTCPFCKCKYIE